MSWKPTNTKSPITAWMPEWLRLITRVCIRLAIICLLLFSLLAYYYFYQAKQFNLDKIAEGQLQNTLLDNTGKVLVSGDSIKSSLISKDDLPQHLIDALIAREDSSFEQHCGVDFRGLVRASLRNLKDLSFTQGASTLSMQLARNTYDIRAKSLNRKFLEIALTLRIEAHYSKSEIMAYYLNRIYFGSGCYGIEQASKKYFKKPTRDLELSESSTLVGIIRGPHIFSPLRNREAAEEQRNQVLDRMVTTEKISAATAEAIKATPLVLPSPEQARNTKEQTVNGYAMKALDRHLNEILAEKDIRAGGLTITSALNLEKLNQCEEGIHHLISSSNSPELQSACVIIDHHSGAIRALVGGVDIKKSAFNRALDSKIDLGDAFTPFIYAIALERNKLPIKGKPAQTGKQLDSLDAIRTAKRFGFRGPFNQDELFYGSATTTPLELATAFSVFSTKGKRPHTYFVENISTRENDLLFSNSANLSQVIQEGSASETLKLLKRKKGTVQYSTYAFGGRALWSMASHKQHTAVLWLGFDQAKPVPNKASLLKKMHLLTYEWVN